jgi:transcriptional regulator with XRE-family HTH domain
MARSNSSLGEFIRRQRELQELSLRQLATMAGISNPYLSQIEHGLRAPSESVLRALARSLELSAETLYEQAGLVEEDEEDQPEVVVALRADPNLTGRQRQALIQIYEAFVAENEARGARRRGRRTAEAHD